MIGTKDGEIFGTEKWADEVTDAINRQGYIIRKWEDGYKVLLDIEYAFGMFTVQAEIKDGEPFTITLKETPEHFAKRRQEDRILAARSS